MRSSKFIFVCLALAFLGPAVANSTNTIVPLANPHDIYGNCVVANGVGTSTVYICLLNPVNPAFGQAGERAVEFVGGFECRFVPTSNVSITSVTFPVFSIDVGTGDSHIVGYTVPVPVGESSAGPVVVLATVEVVFAGGGIAVEGAQTKSPVFCEGASGSFSVREAIPFSSVEGLPSYLDAEDLDDPIVAATCEDGFHTSCSVLFLEGTVSNDASAWGSIKSMYR